MKIGAGHQVEHVEREDPAGNVSGKGTSGSNRDTEQYRRADWRNREVRVRICEGSGVRFPGPT
jgi:hypothetical protein